MHASIPRPEYVDRREPARYTGTNIYTPDEIERIIATAWDDQPPFDRVLRLHGLNHGQVVQLLKRELTPVRTVMVGDGVSDLETRDEVDLFVGFGRYTERAKVKAAAHAFIHRLSDLPALLP